MPSGCACMQVVQKRLNQRTISALPTAVPIVLEDSSAACSPRLGFPPVPAKPSALVDLQEAAAKPSWTHATDSHARQAEQRGRGRYKQQVLDFQQALPVGLPRRVGHMVGSPSPLVSSAPIWILFSASELSRACASVFAAQNSTPCKNHRLDISEASLAVGLRAVRLRIWLLMRHGHADGEEHRMLSPI